MNQRWYSLVNIPVQGGILALFVLGLLMHIVILGAFTAYCLWIFDLFVGFEVMHQSGMGVTVELLWENGSIALGALLVVLAFFCLATLKLSHRIAGPLYRVKDDLREMARTGEIREISVRRDDFFRTFVRELNRVLRMIEDKTTGRSPDEEGPTAP